MQVRRPDTFIYEIGGALRDGIKCFIYVTYRGIVRLVPSDGSVFMCLMCFFFPRESLEITCLLTEKLTIAFNQGWVMEAHV